MIIDEVGYLTYGPDAANVLFHVVNDRHLRKRPIIFTTNKSPLTAWGDVLHDHDLAEAIVDRTLERGRLLVLDGPSHRTLDSKAVQAHAKPDKISGKPRTKFPEPPGARRRRFEPALPSYNSRSLPIQHEEQIVANAPLEICHFRVVDREGERFDFFAKIQDARPLNKPILPKGRRSLAEVDHYFGRPCLFPAS